MRMRIRQLLRSYLFFACGLISLLILGALYIVNGDQIPVVPHDQLDDQVLCYKMAVDHLGAAYYPEFMGGQESLSAPVSIPGMMLFYLLFPAVTAFATNLACVMIMAYVSLYACLRLLKVRDSLSALIGLAFAMLPFYSVYGLSSMGVPLVLCALLLCLRREKLFAPILLCLLYAIFSSLVWVGFAVCFCLLIITVFYAMRRDWTKCYRVGLLLVVLVVTYIVCNFDLLFSNLNPTVAGHRLEFVFVPQPLSLDELGDHFFQGYYHCVSNHYYLAIFDIAVIACIGIYLVANMNQNTGIRELFSQVVMGVAVAFAISLFWLVYLSEIGVAFRSLLPESLRTFQFDRFNWLLPCIWYITTGLAFELVIRIGTGRRTVILSWLVVFIAIALTLNISMRENVTVLNAKSMITGKESSQITWAGFYAEDLFDEIKADIEKVDFEGDARTISVGLHPSVALYNGLSTVDGYSVSYPLAYKYAFSRIIEDELDKSESLYSYFWDWGSRCYAFSHELGRCYVFPKDSGISLKDFSMNVNAMKEMGASYVISGVPIEDVAEHGLELIGEYCTDESYYKLWLYRII